LPSPKLHKNEKGEVAGSSGTSRPFPQGYLTLSPTGRKRTVPWALGDVDEEKTALYSSSELAASRNGGERPCLSETKLGSTRELRVEVLAPELLIPSDVAASESMLLEKGRAASASNAARVARCITVYSSRRPLGDRAAPQEEIQTTASKEEMETIASSNNALSTSFATTPKWRALGGKARD